MHIYYTVHSTDTPGKIIRSGTFATDDIAGKQKYLRTVEEAIAGGLFVVTGTPKK